MLGWEFLRREWPGIVTWVIAIGLGAVAFASFDPQSPLQHVLAALAVAAFVLCIAALGLGMGRAADQRRMRRIAR